MARKEAERKLGLVIPAEVGIHFDVIPECLNRESIGSPLTTCGDDAFGVAWIPAFAGMTTPL